jgi:hypothetical protein
VKIGYTGRDIGRRLVELQTGSPHKLELVCVSYGNLKQEKSIHFYLRNAQSCVLSGEWYKARHKEVLSVVAAIRLQAIDVWLASQASKKARTDYRRVVYQEKEAQEVLCSRGFELNFLRMRQTEIFNRARQPQLPDVRMALSRLLPTVGRRRAESFLRENFGASRTTAKRLVFEYLSQSNDEVVDAIRLAGENRQIAECSVALRCVENVAEL